MAIFAAARPVENLQARLRVAQAMFADLTLDGEQATLPCPAAAQHSEQDRRPSAKLYLSGAPTLTCFHNSCRSELERLNRDLRKRVWEAEAGHGVELQQHIPAAPRVSSQPSAAQRKARWANLGARVLRQALELYPLDPADLWESSPFYLTHKPEDDFRLFMRTLWQPQDVVWCGETRDSGAPKHAANFRTAAAWAELEKAPGPLTCPFVFKSGAHSRSKETALARRHWVMESDNLSQGQAASVFWWVKERLQLPLRAVVHSGNKSIHAWFAVPGLEQTEELNEVMAVAGMDLKVLKTISIPVRLPGWQRQDKGKMMQALLYLDPQACEL